MKKTLFIACTCLLTTTQLFAQDLTQNYRKLILNSSNSTSLFQSNSSNGVWASGMIATDRWGIFEDATTAKERFTILPGGNTGIGTNNPRSKLHVYKGNSGGNPHAFSDITVEDNDNGMISILTPNNKNGYFGFGDSEDDYSGGMEYDHAKDRMILRVNNHNHNITIDSSGNVGIGITNPSEKLTVDGKILCEEVEVVLNVAAPDYVFEKYYTGHSNLKSDYVMPTLEDIEAYTKVNHHLPSVPSAKELKEQGLELKEMSVILLQKIEELTLYTIEQEKRIKALESQIAK